MTMTMLFHGICKSNAPPHLCPSQSLHIDFAMLLEGSFRPQLPNESRDTSCDLPRIRLFAAYPMPFFQTRAQFGSTGQAPGMRP